MRGNPYKRRDVRCTRYIARIVLIFMLDMIAQASNHDFFRQQCAEMCFIHQYDMRWTDGAQRQNTTATVKNRRHSIENDIRRRIASKSTPVRRNKTTSSCCFCVRVGRGTIIPGLLYRIPSELRSQAPVGENSTEMGDLSGSPRVVPTSILVSLLQTLLFPPVTKLS